MTRNERAVIVIGNTKWSQLNRRGFGDATCHVGVGGAKESTRNRYRACAGPRRVHCSIQTGHMIDTS